MKVWRKFLEPPKNDVDSYVKVMVGDNYVTLKVADCNRAIALGFDLAPKKLKDMKAKVDALQLALDKVRAALGVE